MTNQIDTQPEGIDRPVPVDPPELYAALANLADRMAGVEEGAEHLNCTEATSIEDVLRAAGYNGAADIFIGYHYYGDDDIDDVHHQQYHDVDPEFHPREGCACQLPDTGDEEIERRKEDR